MNLRLLDPATDFDLFKTAYNWRTPKRHIQPDRMPFETFVDNDPTHIAVGLFGDELLAVYFLHEEAPGCYQAHFTSRPKVSRNTLLMGAAEVIKLFFDNGALEITVWIVERNWPLRTFVEALGFALVGRQTFPCQTDTSGSMLQSDTRVFTKYAVFGTRP